MNLGKPQNAWFSYTQKMIINRNKNKQKSIIYLSVDNKEIEVTEVGDDNIPHSGRFADSDYVGKVIKWIKNV